MRQIGDKLAVEWKHNMRSNGEVRICDEYAKETVLLPGSVAMKGNTYRYIGNMTTKRVSFDFGVHVISLDENTYLGKVDHEIEIESDAPAGIPRILDGIVSIGKNAPDKYSRFAAYLRQPGIHYTFMGD